MEEGRKDGRRDEKKMKEGEDGREIKYHALARHLISKNFSIPISAPNPASVTT